MAVPFDTLLLDVGAWDLTLDANNNIALATAAYSVAQDISSQCRQWQGEYIYNQDDGVPLATIVGETTSLSLVKSDFAQAAGLVPGASNPICFISAVIGRNLVGQVQATVTLADGTKFVVPASISAPVRFLKFLTNDSGTENLTPDAGGGPLTAG